ncbi:MAG: hypothetical protein HQL32_09545 [Planctomycetes bacterium]|nr:hypothetical protein [Planctomycetota bacterium]
MKEAAVYKKRLVGRKKELMARPGHSIISAVMNDLAKIARFNLRVNTDDHISESLTIALVCGLKSKTTLAEIKGKKLIIK